MTYFNAVGRRKTAVARIYFREGSGSFWINKREFNIYLKSDIIKMKINRPFELLGLNKGSFDVMINVNGGGVNGQADAIRLALSRVLEKYNPEFRPPLKKEGLLTVDSRQVERKKYGRRKARKRFQFSKR